MSSERDIVDALQRAEWEALVLAKVLNHTSLAPLRQALFEVRAALEKT